MAVVGVGVALLASAGFAFSQTDKVDRALRDAIQGGARTQNVIISVKPGYVATLRRALQDHGDFIKTEHQSIAAVSAKVHAGDISQLALQWWVEGVSLDADVFAAGGNVLSGASQPPGAPGLVLPSLNAPNTRLRESLGLPAVAGGGSPSGAGVVVAVIDSGISASRDLDAGRITAFYDFTRSGCLDDPGSCAAAPSDDLGHGTHVAGLIGSSGALSRNLYQGVAPQVKFVGIKVLKADGSGKTSDVIAAIEFVTKHRGEWGAQVIINLSLGHAIFTPAILDPLVRAVERASAAGIVVVVAAGNNARTNTYTGITSPANAPSALTTGAVDTNRTPVRLEDWVAGYSARGPTWFDAYVKPDFVAPGSRLISDTTIESTLFQVTGSNAIVRPVYDIPEVSASGRISIDGYPFLQLSGTSMAAGVVSGVVALVLEANRHTGAPPLTPNAIKAILQYTATSLTVNNPDTLTQGAGQINAAGAVALARTIDTRAPLGEWWLTSAVDESTPFGAANRVNCALPNCRVEMWTRNIIWGSKIVAGDMVHRKLLIWAGNILWGTDVAWNEDSSTRGTADSSAAPRKNILWGTRLVYGNPVLMASVGDESSLNTILWGAASGAQVVRQNIVWSASGLWGTNLAPGRVIGIREAGTITWTTVPQALNDGDNILWGTWESDNILWGTWDSDNILWGTSESDGNVIITGTSMTDADNILWGTWDGDNILWGTSAFDGDNILWGTWDGDNILWGTSDGDNILWGTVFRRSGGF